MTGQESPRATECDRLLETIRHRYRRAVLTHLRDRSEPVDVETLAAELPVDTEVERLALVLHHVHLPKLAAADLVSYDATDHRVELSVESLPKLTWPGPDRHAGG